jgi:hypothetical protein
MVHSVHVHESRKPGILSFGTLTASATIALSFASRAICLDAFHHVNGLISFVRVANCAFHAGFLNRLRRFIGLLL